jgi:hypothetical protein
MSSSEGVGMCVSVRECVRVSRRVSTCVSVCVGGGGGGGTVLQRKVGMHPRMPHKALLHELYT